MLEAIKNYIQLTKPTIMVLVVLTGITALIVEGSLVAKPLDFFLVLFALYLTGGSANALNQYFERDIDKNMTRTSKRRPLPQQKIDPQKALAFSITIGIAGVLIFALFFNWLTAMLSLATILFYSLFYTLFLKPNTSQNIVIGGIAGAMAPVGAWTAAAGHLELFPWLLFLIVFLWTPPHFWALALFHKEDYRRVKLPMMPVIKGDEITLRQILIYTIVLVITSLTLSLVETSWIYLIAAIVLGSFYLKKSFVANRYRTEKHFKGLFGYSIIYLFAIFIMIMVDSVLYQLIF
jgi:protoheme IX farnesyltransferase